MKGPSAIDELVAAAKAGRLVVFIGAGPSTEPPACLPTWEKFCMAMADFAEPFQPTRATLMREEVQEGRLLASADFFIQADKVPRSEREKFFLKNFDVPKDKCPSVYSLLARLPAAHWLTTNFDPFLGGAIAKECPNAEVLDNSPEHIRAMLSAWSAKHFCLYMHGRAHIYDTLVYHGVSYLALRSRPEYKHLLRRVFTECTILFYGYSVSDPDIVETLEYVANDLAGAGNATHYLLTSSPRWLDHKLLSKANVVVIPYTASDDHKEAKDIFRELIHRCPRAGSLGFPDIHSRNQVRELANIFCSLFEYQKNSSAYESAAGAIVLAGLMAAPHGLKETELLEDVRRRTHTDEISARNILRSGLRLLRSSSKIAEVAGVLQPTSTVCVDHADAIVDVIETRLLTFNSQAASILAIRETIRSVVSHILLAQGLTVARAYVNEDDIAGYDLEGLARGALGLLPRVGYGAEDDLVKSVCSVLREPDSDTGQSLFRLAHAAYALESVFLNPGGVSLGESLRWKIYLDTNIVLRILFPVRRNYATFARLLERCGRLGTPVAVIYPFVEECAAHIDLLRAFLREKGIDSKDGLMEYLETVPADARSPVLEAFAVEVARAGWHRFDEFLQKRHVQSEAALTSVLRNRRIEVEGEDILRRLDTSERETLWAELRAWRHDQSASGRKLRRNEASQIEWMVRLRAAGVRSWFLSIDGQLRRALLTLQKGYYAGFVMTPTAWAMRLADLHWGEVDFGGFSAFMWSMAAQPIEERAQEIVLRKVLEQPEARGESPEWLREQVDDLFARRAWKTAFRASAGPSSHSAADETEFLSLAEQILPVSVQAVLDAIARRKKGQGK